MSNPVFLIVILSLSALLLTQPAIALDTVADSLGIDAQIKKSLDPTRSQPEPIEKLIIVGRYERALALVDSANIINDNPAFAKRMLCLLLLDRYEDSIGLAKQKLSLDNSDSTVGYLQELIGACNLKLGHNPEALKAFTRAIEIFPTVTAYTGRAKVYSALDRNILAEEDINQATLLSPHENQSNLPFSNLPFPIKAVPGTRFDFVGFCKLKTLGGPLIDLPITSTVESSKAAVRAEDSGDFDKAASLYRKSLESASRDVLLWNKLGLSVLTSQFVPDGKGDLKEAISCFQTASSLAPEDWRFQYNLALVQYGCENYIDTVQTTEALLKSHKVPEESRRVLLKIHTVCKNMQMLKQNYEPLK